MQLVYQSNDLLFLDEEQLLLTNKQQNDEELAQNFIFLCNERDYNNKKEKMTTVTEREKNTMSNKEKREQR